MSEQLLTATPGEVRHPQQTDPQQQQGDRFGFSRFNERFVIEEIAPKSVSVSENDKLVTPGL